MTTIVIIAVLAALVLVVLFSPLWYRRQQRGLTSVLTRYENITDALLEGNLPRAREELKEVVRADTEDVGSCLRLARIFRREGDAERAVALRRSLVARDLPDRRLRVKLLEGLVVDLLQLRRYAEARAVAATLRGLDRGNAQVLRAEFYAALERADWGAAQKALGALSRAGLGRQDPEPFQLRTYVAARLAAAGDRREARRLLEEALKANPQYAPAQLLLGDLWMEEPSAARAAEVWGELLRRRPETAAHVIPRLEKAYFEMGRFGELASLYEELTADAGARVPALRLALARMALRKGEAAEALRVIDELPADDPAGGALSCWRLYFMLESGRPQAAQAELKKIVEAAVGRPSAPLCLHCGSPVAAHAARCEQCLSWLPDPFVRRGPAAPQRSL